MIESDSHNGTYPSNGEEEYASEDCASTPVTEDGDIGDLESAIAIVGMAVRLPGGITSPDGFWEALIKGEHGLCEVPSTRYNIDSFYGPGKSHAVKTRKGYFLQQDPALFDANFFSIKAAEAERMDPQQRQLLEVTWECLESAGETRLRGADVGCYVGVFGEDWVNLEAQDPQATDRYHVSSTGQFVLANRLSYQWDWRGPSMTIQTACSSSLAALHEGCQALLRRDCNAAVVAGVNLILTPTMTMVMSDGKVLSPNGSCKTFDAAADGYGRGEGVCVTLIKRLGDAIRDNDPIRAIVRGTSINFDGKTPTVSTPGAQGQKSLIRKAYQRAGIRDIGRTAFFECHGTGTPIGDVIETSVIAKILAEEKSPESAVTIVGSVKPNVGHTEGASGLTSVIKAVLCLEHELIPPNIFFNTPNPKIPFTKAKLLVPREPTKFPAGKKKRVSVNCFGVGGSNAHAILDSTTSFANSHDELSQHLMAKREPTSPPKERSLVVLSAKTPEAIEKRISDLLGYVECLEESGAKADILEDLSCTLCSRREHFSHRSFAVINPNRPLARSDFRTSQVRSISPVWVFTGQGSQSVGMAQQLLSSNSGFKEDMESLEGALKTLKDAPTWSINEELSKSSPSESPINETEFSQTLCTAVAIGLINQLRRWGLQAPSAVIGHSSGELAAAYASGAISAESAIILSYYRGLVSSSQEGKGAMVSIDLAWKDVAPYLNDVTGVVVACRNSPRNTVLSGNPVGLEQVINRIKASQTQVFCRKLRVSVAYHSQQMSEPSMRYQHLIASHIQQNPEMVPMYSTVSLAKITDPATLDASYWSSGLASPVQFADAVEEAILDHPDSQVLFLEIGPHAALSGPLRQIFDSMRFEKSDDRPIYVPTLTRNDDDAISQLLSGLGHLHSVGVPMDLLQVTGHRKVISNLSAYSWDRQRYWRESRLTRDWRLQSARHHELLGSRIVAMSDNEPAWRNLLRLSDVLWLGDHMLCKNIIFPVAGYIAMVGAACMQLQPDSVAYTVGNLTLTSFLTLLPRNRVEILTTFKRQRYNELTNSDWYMFTVSSNDGGSGWIKHCHGEVCSHVTRAPNDKIQPGKVNQSYARKINPEQWYRLTRKHGYEYGQRFRGLANISTDPINIAATGSINDEPPTSGEYALHPTDIDRCLQLMGVASARGLPRRIGVMQVPVSVGSVYVTNRSAQVHTHVRAIDDGGQSLSWNANVLSNQGDKVLSIENLRSVTMDKARMATSSIPTIAGLRWKPFLDLLAPKVPLLLNPEITQEGDTWKYVLYLLGHQNPRLRVLEIGASSPNTTESNFNYLKTSQKTHLMSSYTITDTSNIKLDKARLRFNDNSLITFKVLDLAQDIRTQGIELHTFDLVVASDASQWLPAVSIRAITQLLSPSGWLLLQDACIQDDIKPQPERMNSTEDSVDAWKRAVKAAGYEAIESSVRQDESAENTPNNTRLTLLAKAPKKARSWEPVSEITLLADAIPGVWEEMVASELSRKGYTITWSTLRGTPSPGRYIISLLDLRGPYFHNASQESFENLQEYLLRNQSKHILWLTRSTQLQCHDPRYGLVHGLARSLRRECNLDISLLELDSIDFATLQTAVGVHDWIIQEINSGTRKRDFEFAIYEKTVYVGRYHWTQSIPGGGSNNSTEEAPKKLCLQSNSLLQQTIWATVGETTLGVDEIEVDIKYVGLNFRDVMVAMGLVGNKSQIGLEASGIVLKVGDQVTEFQVGDKVGIMGSGLCTTRTCIAAASCWKIPERLSLQDASAVLVPYLTAIYSLLHVGGLRTGQSVLIHSACGGVGLAALQVCQTLGAKIYATVGSEEKVEYLMQRFSLPRTQIFNSRDDSFLANLMKETTGRGVDIVLNSLAGKLLQTSWQCVASFGKMIELGKIDISTNGSLNMSPFSNNRTFVGIDLLQLGQERPEVLNSLVEEVLEWFRAGNLASIPLDNIFEASDAVSALRQMQKGQHIGKLLLKLPEDTNQLIMTSDPPPISFHHDASYLIVGGMGGLGRAVSNWMAEEGAGELVFLSRSAGKSSADEDFIKELSAHNCRAICIAGSVTNLEDVKRAVAACTNPIRGVLQMSALLQDRTFGNMTFEEWTTCLEPKVQGTWNLHEATQGHRQLDFFVVFGSLAGVCGNSGQANYAAANTYLESFVNYRRQLGLPCSALNLGPVEDAGMISQDQKLLQAMRSARCHLLSEKEVIEGLNWAVSQSRPSETRASGANDLPLLSSPAIVNIGLSMTQPSSESNARTSWAKEARFAMYANLESNTNLAPQVVDDKFRAFVARIDDDPSILNEPETEILVSREIGRLITGYLGNGTGMKDEEIASIAIDSLMAIEVKDFVRGNMNMDIGMDQTSRAKTVGELAHYTVERLKVKYGLVVE